MKRVFTADNIALAWHVNNILQSNSIKAEVRNDSLHSAQGGIPVTECNPEVWIFNETDEQLAAQLIEEQQSSDQTIQKPDWNCAKCGEQNFAQFKICWNCQTAHSEID